MRRLNLILLVILTTSLLAPLRAFAVLGVPPGLQPGDSFQWVFATSGTHDAVSADVTDYNAFVQSQANMNLDLSGITFKAIGSTALVDARVNAAVSAPVYRLDGANVATGFSDMWDGTLNATISVNQFNQAIVVANSPVHTGSDSSGFKWSAGGGKWLGSSLVLGGDALSSTSTWLALGQQTNDHAKHFYGLSEVLTVSAVPEASTVTAWFLLSGFAAATYAWRRFGVSNASE